MTPQGRVIPLFLCGVRVSFLVSQKRVATPCMSNTPSKDLTSRVLSITRLGRVPLLDSHRPNLVAVASTANRGFLPHYLGAWCPG